MRAMILDTPSPEPLDPLTRSRPMALMRIADKPLIYHLIEFLASQGWRRFDLLLHHFPDMVEAKLGDGKRWGVEITYQLMKDPSRPFTLASAVAGGWISDDLVLLGQIGTLPMIRFAECPSPQAKPSLIIGKGGHWTGWGLFFATQLANVPYQADNDTLTHAIPHTSVLLADSRILSTTTLDGLLEANQGFLEGKFSCLTPPATTKKIEEGVWIASSAQLHPTAVVHKPVFIGRNSRLMEHVQVGPNVVIESNCIVDARSTLNNSLVCQQSYVGDFLEIQQSIVDRGWLVHLTRKAKLRIKDAFILSDLSAPPLSHKLFSALEQIVGSFVLLALSPLLAPLVGLYGLEKKPVLLLPSPQTPTKWAQFNWLRLRCPGLPRWMQELPNWIHVALGRLHLVGVPPRSPQAVTALPADWRHLYLSAKVGLVHLYPEEASEDEAYAGDVYYTALAGPWFDVKTLLSKLLRAS